MRVLLVSKEGDGLGVAQRLALEGDTVDVFIEEPRFAKAGRGFVNRVSSLKQPLKDADLIISDMVGMGHLASRLGNKPSIGFSEVLDKIELDRVAGMRLFEQAGVETPVTVAFSNLAEARNAPQAHGWHKGWVIKPNGNLSTAKTMVVKDQSQWERQLGKLPASCSGIVQQIVSGIEVSTEMWFNGREAVQLNHTFEEKRFLAGNLGQNTGCMGNVVIACGVDKLVRRTVKPLESFLRYINYCGPFDVNCIVDEDHAYALEVTSRMGYDAVEALIEGLEQPAGLFLHDVARGYSAKPAMTDEVMIAVRLSIPPWPMRKPDVDAEPDLVQGINDTTLPHLFLTDLYRDGPDEPILTANGDGVLLKATAVGRPRRDRASKDGSRQWKTDYTYEARRRVYRLLDQIDVPSKQYRTDIGERVNEDWRRLAEWGWIEP